MTAPGKIFAGPFLLHWDFFALVKSNLPQASYVAAITLLRRLSFSRIRVQNGANCQLTKLKHGQFNLDLWFFLILLEGVPSEDPYALLEFTRSYTKIAYKPGFE